MIKARLTLAFILALLLCTLVPAVAGADDPPTRYINCDVGVNVSANISGSYWVGQQFTVGSTSHTVTSIRLSIQRVGVPGYMYASIRAADASDNMSRGYDLAVSDAVASLTVSNSTSQWTEFIFDEISLEAGERYIVILRAPDGDDDNYVSWASNTTGYLANAVGSHSDDAGVTWTTDSPTDYLFSVWGDPVMSLSDVEVFTGFRETGDFLFVFRYYNEFTPYSVDGFAAAYFTFQLLDLSDVVVAETNVRAWGYRPGSIYLSAAAATVLEWGEAYTLKMVGNFGSNPEEDYVLTASDWHGDELLLLDHWAITTARYIETEENEDLVTDVGGVEILNDRGQTIFALGIPYITTVRPDLFETSRVDVRPDDQTFDVTVTDPDTELGTYIMDWLDDGRVFVGADTASSFGTILAVAGGTAIIAILATLGHLVAGLAIAFVGLIATTLIGITDWRLLGVVTFLGAAVWLFHHFSSK